MRHARLLLVVAAVAGSAAMGSGQSTPGSPRVSLVRLPDWAIQPQLVADAAGVLHLLYFKGKAAHGDLFYAQVGGNGSFSRTTPVNARSGSAIATGTMRGGHLAIGRNGRVHVAWHGSDQAQPRAQDGATPVLYTRMNAAGSVIRCAT